MQSHDYNFSIFPLLKEGLKQSDGFKGTFIGAFIIFLIITIILNAILEAIFPSNSSGINSIIAGILSGVITVPIQVGITMMGINRVRGKELNTADMFNYFAHAMPIVITYILMYLMISIGFLLLVLPGIYLAISYTFAYQLVVDKGLKTWEAMELSRKTVTAHWFKFFGLSLVVGFAIVISAIPFGIGLIWTIPMTYISYGLLYHHLFDDEFIEA